ncbi:MAG: hypothetical protein EOP04_33755, partial [Proteobacteria bacterium]
NALLNVFVDDLKRTRWNGYKLGMQYNATDNSWGVGANYRSNVAFNAKGTSRGTFESGAPGGTGPITGGDATIGNAFPEQYVLGGFYRVSDNLRISPEYSFSHYSRNKQLDLGGTFTIPGLGTRQLVPIQQAWKNQHVGRIGSEYRLNEMWVGRAGYAWTSQVSADSFARSTFSSPGSGHAATIGAGYTVAQGFDLDAALEYSWASGTATNTTLARTATGANGSAQEVANPTKFSTSAYAAHLGGTYRF